ncbi:MAG: HPF/RaiA family ribosome-associated protein [Patescibacteria group bacterium]
MNLIIKTRGNQPIGDRDKKWAEAKFAKLAKLCPAETVVEVTLEDLYGPKGGRDKRVHVLAEMPHAPEPFHLEETDLKFRKAISTARARFERYLKRYREKHESSSRRPRKYWLAKVLEKFSRGQTDDGQTS